MAFNQISDESIRLMEEALATRQLMPDQMRGITAATGFVGYDLEAPAKVINPVITPLVNMIPRKPGPGIDVTHWKAITSFDTARNWGDLGTLTPEQVSYSVVSMQNTYQTIALGNSVTFQAQWQGRSLEGDVRARRMAELLYQVKIQEERWIINASALIMVPPAPIVSVSAVTGGHALDSTTYWIQITAVNAQGETTASTATSVTTAANSGTNVNILALTIFTVANASYYNVYIGSGATQPANSGMWLQALYSGVSHAPQPGFNVQTALLSGGTVPSGEVEGPIIAESITAAIVTSAVAHPPTTNTAVTTIDVSSNPTTWDGLIQQGLLNTGTGNGLTLGTQVVQPAATNGKLALSDVDNMLISIYNQAAGDPDFLVMNPITHRFITNLIISSGQTRFVVEANQPETQGRLTAQYRVTHYLNESTGKEIPIIPNRYCPAHTIMALPMSIPFPVAEVSNAIEIETNQEYWGVDFAITDSSFKFADYVNETLKVYFLGGLGVLRGIIPTAS